jgi:hypothetical protein
MQLFEYKSNAVMKRKISAIKVRFCPGGGIGRHKGFKIPRSKGRAGSSPAPGTNSDNNVHQILLFAAMFMTLSALNKVAK